MQRPRIRTSSLLLGGFGVVAALLLAWSLQQRDDAALAGQTTVRLQLQWLDQAQFLGHYVAVHEKYYEMEGLKVELIAGGPTIDPIKQVFAGQADIGLATANQVLRARARGDSIRAIGTVFSQSVAVFMSLSKTPVASPKDLPGKKIGVFPSADTEDLLKALAKLHGVDFAKISVVQYPALPSFWDGDLDAFPSYLFNEPIEARERQLSVELLRPDKFGIHFYSDTYFCSDDYLRQNREVVRRFLRATARGWSFARANRDQAIDMMFQQTTSLARALKSRQASMADSVFAYLGRDQDDHYFEMNYQRWKDMERALFTVGVLPDTGFVRGLIDLEVAREANGDAR